MSLMEQNFVMEKLSYEIFSILENKFLFSDSAPATPIKTPTSPKSFDGKVRIVSIDGGGDGLLAAVSLVRLESSLQKISGDSGARIADFFDVAAGSGNGGVLAAMLFSRGHDGRPLFSAEEALRFVSKNHRSFATKKNSFSRIFGGGGRGIFRKMFDDSLTLRDTMKPVLIPCYDMATGAPFLFSRADAMETDSFDFKMSQICAATCAGYDMQIKSVDGRSKIIAVGGNVATANPTAAAITHVLNNKQEFPLASGVDDLLVISLGSGVSDIVGTNVSSATPSRTEMLKIAGNGIADTVDQAVGMAFGHSTASNYVRIQANGFFPKTTTKLSKNSSGNSKNLVAQAESMLTHRNIESVLFRGKKLSEETNAQKLEWFSGELIKEHERRKSSPIPTVLMKQAMTPRTSSATTSTIITVSTGSSTSP